MLVRNTLCDILSQLLVSSAFTQPTPALDFVTPPTDFCTKRRGSFKNVPLVKPGAE